MNDTQAPALDRSSHLRADPEAMKQLENDPNAIAVPIWRDRNVVRSGAPLYVPAAPLLALHGGSFLGMLGEAPCFAIPLPGAEQPPAELLDGAEKADFADLRFVGPQLSTHDAQLLGYARGLLYWQRQYLQCGRCGAETELAEAGHTRVCKPCDRRSFPRTDPAIMAAIVHDGRLLLARQPGFPLGMFSVLAGFVEPGESLEQAVQREVFEEVGLKVVDLRYVGSQPWPFPASLMLGFAMQARSDEFKLDDDELEDARWLSAEQLSKPDGFFVPPTFSLSGQLIQSFIRGEL